MTVGENIFLGRFHENHGMRGTHKKARELLDSIGSTISTYSLVGDLSASEMQMVEITKALSFDSKLIIMDEPSSSLTSEELRRLGTIINQLRDKGISIIYISHKLDEIFEYCDIVTIMRDGHVIDTKPVQELTRGEMIAKMVGRTIDNEYPPRAHCVGEPLMEVRNLNTHKLHDINFTLHKGEILGLVGLVGAAVRKSSARFMVRTRSVAMKLSWKGRRSTSARRRMPNTPVWRWCRRTGSAKV